MRGFCADLCTSITTPKLHKAAIEQPLKGHKSSSSKDGTSSTESLNSTLKLDADQSTNCTDTEPNSSEVAEMVASAAAATANYDSMLGNTTMAATYKVDICKE